MSSALLSSCISFALAKEVLLYQNRKPAPQCMVSPFLTCHVCLFCRCKTKTVTTGPVKDVSELPIWNFDGSSTGDAEGHDSEVRFQATWRGGLFLLHLYTSHMIDNNPAGVYRIFTMMHAIFRSQLHITSIHSGNMSYNNIWFRATQKRRY